MDFKINLLILKNKAKLEKLINSHASDKKILYQSKRLDKYIIKQMKEINKKSGFATCTDCFAIARI